MNSGELVGWMAMGVSRGERTRSGVKYEGKEVREMKESEGEKERESRSTRVRKLRMTREGRKKIGMRDFLRWL